MKNVIVIPISNTPLASKTAVQMNAIVAEYFEGVDYITNPKITTVGLNLFDKTTVTLDKRLGSGVLITLAGVATSDYIAVIPLAAYHYYYHTNAHRELAYYDYDKNYISSLTGSSIIDFTPPAGVYYLRITAGMDYLDVTQLEQGTSATDYVAHKTDTQTFKNTDGSDLDMLSVGTSVRDLIYYYNGVWYKDKYVDLHTLVSGDIIGMSTSKTNYDSAYTSTTLIPTMAYGSFELYNYPSYDGVPADSTASIGLSWIEGDRIRVAFAKGTSLGDAQTALTDEILYYASEIDTIEIESNGSIIQESITTVIQEDNFATKSIIEFSMNSKDQTKLLTDKAIYHGKEIDNLEVEVKTNADEIDSTETDIIAIELKTDFITVTEAIDLDTAITAVALYDNATGVTVPTSDTIGDKVQVGSFSNMSDYDELWIYCNFGGDDIKKIMNPTYEQYMFYHKTFLASTANYDYYFRTDIVSDSLYVYGSHRLTTTWSTGIIADGVSGTALKITKVYGINFI